MDMLKKVIFVIVLVVFQQQVAFACKCIIPNPEIETAITNTEIIFIGQCVAAEFVMGEEANSDRGYTVRYKFKVQQIFKGLSPQEVLVVETGIGFGDCGFEFRLGVSFLVYANMVDNIAQTSICKRTDIAGIFPDRLTEKVEIEIKKNENYLNKK